MLKKVLALTLCLTLCLSLSMGAAAAAGDAGGTIEGDAGLKTPVYMVVVPTSPEFAIDPIEMGGNGQLYSGDNGYVFINRTSAPVLVSLDLTVTASASSGVTIVDAAAKVDQTLNAPADQKNIYLGVHGPKTMAATGGTTIQDPSIDVTDVIATFDPVKGVIPMTVTDTKTAELSFGLLLDTGVDGDVPDDAASLPTSVDDNYANSEKSLGSFKVYAALTTYNKTWKANDLSIEGVYTFQGLRTADYTKAAATPVTDTLNLYQSGIPMDYSKTTGGKLTHSIASTKVLDYVCYTGADPILKMPTTEYSYTSTTFTLNTNCGLKGTWYTVGGVYGLTLVFKDGTQEQVMVTIKA